MRLQRALARAGVASRRRSEELIRAGRVRVNGQVAKLGTSVDTSADVIEVNGRQVRPSAPVWMALHKPAGYVVSRKDQRGRPTVFTFVPSVAGLTYVGRLDVATTGLLLFTTDGETAHRLTHPRYGVERSYRAVVCGREPEAIRRALARPIRIDGRQVQVASARVRKVRDGRSELTIVLTEGRYRIVRRVCSKLGLEVEQLTRLSHGPIRLGRLPVGKWRYLSKTELRALASV